MAKITIVIYECDRCKLKSMPRTLEKLTDGGKQLSRGEEVKP